jgi:hypothetical protein
MMQAETQHPTVANNAASTTESPVTTTKVLNNSNADDESELLDDGRFRNLKRNQAEKIIKNRHSHASAARKKSKKFKRANASVLREAGTLYVVVVERRISNTKPSRLASRFIEAPFVRFSDVSDTSDAGDSSSDDDVEEEDEGEEERKLMELRRATRMNSVLTGNAFENAPLKDDRPRRATLMPENEIVEQSTILDFLIATRTCVSDRRFFATPLSCFRSHHILHVTFQNTHRFWRHQTLRMSPLTK